MCWQDSGIHQSHLQLFQSHLTEVNKLSSIMKLIVAFAALIAVALAAAVEEKTAQVLKYDSDVGVDGYSFQFDTSNGIQQQEKAELKKFADDVAALVVRGSYSYTGSDGQVYTVNYVADENGFQPEAAHLPKA
ncbi:AAEL013520-PA [Aedes aegypti]|uniref:AAEL013520-PA n=2 Tax=Aedes aegypti TaxID=7159 RepID=Q16IX4_AEDAE|nr:AAEL013520-PA [Aedes aegypti]